MDSEVRTAKQRQGQTNRFYTEFRKGIQLFNRKTSILLDDIRELQHKLQMLAVNLLIAMESFTEEIFHIENYEGVRKRREKVQELRNDLDSIGKNEQVSNEQYVTRKAEIREEIEEINKWIEETQQREFRNSPVIQSIIEMNLLTFCTNICGFVMEPINNCLDEYSTKQNLKKLEQIVEVVGGEPAY
jgi:hypothetical protein